MPSWLLPSLLTGGLTLLLSALAAIWSEIKASEARQNKRIDELREDVKELRKKVDDLPLKIMEMLRKAPH